jgi:riboflavin kinase / FMN adenylyltransferase
MKRILDYIQNIHNNEPLTLTFGNFDGVHIGHQQLIEMTTSFNDTKSAVLTFDPHPQQFLKSQSYQRLMSPLEKMEVIESMHVDYMFTVIFDLAFSQMDHIAFIEFLKSIHVKRIVLGHDARFGHHGQGKVDDLRQHFEIVIVESQLFQDKRISSSLIKALLKEGELHAVKQLLTRPYRIHGKVEHGNHLGRTLGYPTANIAYDQFQIPKLGVYAVKVYVLGKMYYGMANIGHNPTINYQTDARLEVYIFDFSQDLYHKFVTLDFIEYIRNERRFQSKEALIEQLHNDELEIRKRFQRDL